MAMVKKVKGSLERRVWNHEHPELNPQTYRTESHGGSGRKDNGSLHRGLAPPGRCPANFHPPPHKTKVLVTRTSQPVRHSTKPSTFIRADSDWRDPTKRQIMGHKNEQARHEKTTWPPQYTPRPIHSHASSSHHACHSSQSHLNPLAPSLIFRKFPLSLLPQPHAPTHKLSEGKFNQPLTDLENVKLSIG